MMRRQEPDLCAASTNILRGLIWNRIIARSGVWMVMVMLTPL